MFKQLIIIFLVILSFGYITIEVQASALGDLEKLTDTRVGNIPDPVPVCYAYYDENGNLVYATPSNPCPDTTQPPKKSNVKTPVKNPVNKVVESTDKYDPDCADTIFDSKKTDCKIASKVAPLPVIQEIHESGNIIESFKNKFSTISNWFTPQKTLVSKTPTSTPKPKSPIKLEKTTRGIISVHSQEIIENILEDTNIKSISITSTYRTPKDQARAMFDNLEYRRKAYEKEGKNEVLALSLAVKDERNLYCPKYGVSGACSVINLYSDGVKMKYDSTEIKSAMQNMISDYAKEGKYVSHHLMNPYKEKINVIVEGQDALSISQKIKDFIEFEIPDKENGGKKKTINTESTRIKGNPWRILAISRTSRLCKGTSPSSLPIPRI